MKKLKKDIHGFVGAGAALGVGTLVVAKAGGTSVLPAFSTAAGMMRPMAVGMMGMHTIRLVDKMYKPKRRR